MYTEHGTKSVDLLTHYWVNRVLNDNESDNICITAGYGSGKSHGSWQWLIEKTIENPACKKFIYTEPTYPLINKVAIPAFRKLMALYGLEEKKDFTVRGGSEPLIRLHRNKQEIILQSTDNPDSIVGFEVGFAVMDEAALCKEESFQRLQARMRATGVKKKHQILLVSTPEGINWLADNFDSEQQGWVKASKYYAHKISKQFTDQGLELTVNAHYRLTTYVNKMFLPTGYIAKIFSAYGDNEDYIDSYVRGYFKPFAQGRAYSNYKRAIHLIDPIEPTAHKPIHLAWDYNITPVWVAIQQQRELDYNGDRTYFDACIMNSDYHGKQLDDACADFAIKFPVEEFGDTPILIYGDSSGHKESHKSVGTDFTNIKRHLKQAGYTQLAVLANKSNPLQRTSVDFVQTAFANNKLRICNNCDKVISSLERTVWKDNERKELSKPVGETWTHPMDAVKYYFCAKEKGRNRKISAGRK